MNKCKFCGESSPNIIGDICVDCLANLWGDIIEMSENLIRDAMQNNIKFVDIRGQDIGWNFALFDGNTESFITINNRSVWNYFLDLEASILADADGRDPTDIIKLYAEKRPDWVPL